MECVHCDAVLKNKYSLLIHQQKTKYCLKKQGKTNDKYECTYCNKKISTQQQLNVHYTSCTKKKIQEKVSIIQQHYDRKVDELELENLQLKQQNAKHEKTIQDLQDKLANIAIKAVQRPTTTNMNKTNVNNFINNMEPITSAHLLEHTGKLTLEHIQKGASGYAEYALEYPLKNRVACVDYSRRKLKFKDNEGNLITDPEMIKLTPMFFDSIKDKSSEIVYDMNKDDMDSAMFEEVAKLFNTNADVKNCASGVKSDFYHDFVKHVCSGSVVE